MRYTRDTSEHSGELLVTTRQVRIIQSHEAKEGQTASFDLLVLQYTYVYFIDRIFLKKANNYFTTFLFSKILFEGHEMRLFLRWLNQ